MLSASWIRDQNENEEPELLHHLGFLLLGYSVSILAVETREWIFPSSREPTIPSIESSLFVFHLLQAGIHFCFVLCYQAGLFFDRLRNIHNDALVMPLNP